jgi:hypothetical protein
MPGRMRVLTSDGEGKFALETAAFHDSELNSMTNAAFGGFGGVSPPIFLPLVGGEVRRGGKNVYCHGAAVTNFRSAS